jgi:hypothetical protein
VYKINKNTSGITGFILVTVGYLVIYYLTFNGFNGSDDLHYARLASNMLNGNYHPFEPYDIFAGRALLISWQAFIYYIGGINIFTTQIGSIIAIILSCYLTIFKLGNFKNWQPIFGCAALFYFNPVINTTALGISPDVYIMLFGIILLLLWVNIKQETNKKKTILKSLLFGTATFLALFIKENAIIFIPFIFFISLVDNRRKNFRIAIIAIAAFLLCVFFSGFVYYHYTGDYFLRVHQIINSSSTANGCMYNMNTLGALIKRLTFGAWQRFVTEGFYPVILAAFLLIIKVLKTKNIKIEVNNIEKIFIILLLLGLYFPFSVKGYQPLCIRCRHFIFLLAPAVILCVSNLEEALKRKHSIWEFIAASTFILCICVASTGNKWFWMIYLLLLVFFILLKICHSAIISKYTYFILTPILLLFIFYNTIYYKSKWFQNLQAISAKVDEQSFYFPDHDNMLHFQLLHGFNKNYSYYNLQKEPYKIYSLYYNKLDSTNFRKGWLIINKAYTEASPNFLSIADSLKSISYFKKQFTEGDVDAFYIDTKETLQYIKTSIIEKEDK